jgi:PAS domain S-box-containing protein
MSEVKENKIQNNISTKKLKEHNQYLENTHRAILNILEDVAESEHNLRKKTMELEKFQQAADASFDYIMIADVNAIILYVNRAAEEMTGYSREEIVGKNFKDLWNCQASKEICDKMWDVIRNEKSPYAGEFKNKRKNGQKYLTSVRISPILDKKRDIKFYVIVERDITEEREVQVRIIRDAQKLQEANALMEQQKERAEGILRFLKSIGDGIIATDLEEKIIFFNEAAEKLTGVSSELAMGKKSSEVLDIFGEKNPEKRFDIIAEALECSGNLCKTTDRFFLKRKNEFRVDISFSIAMIYDTQRKEQGCILSMHDVSEERELEKTKDNFLSVAAHQLRTPLSGIRWNLEMLLNGDVGKLPKEAKEVVHDIDENNLRLVALVNDLLNVSRINMGKSMNLPEQVVVVENITLAIKSLNGFADKNKIKIVFDEKKNSKLKVMIIPRRFVESVGNVISNAVKYSPVEGVVKISVAEKAGNIEIAVTDAGIGIPKKDQSKIFSKFFRAGNATIKDPDGSGLGLNVVKSFIEEAGGTVSFESEEGKGTTFLISLPAYIAKKTMKIVKTIK